MANNEALKNRKEGQTEEKTSGGYMARKVKTLSRERRKEKNPK
jgi:hypothetical protein